MALLESTFSAANSSAGLVETAIFVLDERRAVPALQAALRRSQPACARRARQALAARSHRSAYSHSLLSGLTELAGVSCGLLVWSARVPHRSIRLMRLALSDNL